MSSVWGAAAHTSELLAAPALPEMLVLGGIQQMMMMMMEGFLPLMLSPWFPGFC